MSFNPEWDRRLPRDMAEQIILLAERLGDGVHFKDTFWRGYKFGDRFFLGLNDFPDIWETDEATAREYATTP